MSRFENNVTIVFRFISIPSCVVPRFWAHPVYRFFFQTKITWNWDSWYMQQSLTFGPYILQSRFPIASYTVKLEPIIWEFCPIVPIKLGLSTDILCTMKFSSFCYMVNNKNIVKLFYNLVYRLDFTHVRFIQSKRPHGIHNHGERGFAALVHNI